MSPGLCAHCHRTLRGGFDIVRQREDGQEAGRVNVCSIFCLLNWGYAYALRRGLGGVVTAKGAFDRLVEALKGSRG